MTYSQRKRRGLSEFGVVDLFCGAGGLSTGFSRVGFSVIGGVDINEEAISTFNYNHECDGVVANLKDGDGLEIIKNNISDNGHSVDDVSVVVGGPPCKGFSRANIQTGHSENPKNNLAERYIQLATSLNPEIIVMENVPNMLSMDDGKFEANLIDQLQSNGYSTNTEELSADDFGVPQARNRAIIVGVKSGDAPTVSDASKLFPDPPTVRDAIFDLPSLPTGGGGSEKMEYSDQNSVGSESINDWSYIHSMREFTEPDVIYNHQSTRNREKTYRRFKHVPQGGNWRDIPTELMSNYKNLEKTHDNVYERLSELGIAKTVTNFRKQMMIHPVENRLLTVREAARLQSFPDHYKFISSGICAKQQMVGNAVPIRLAEGVAHGVAEQLSSDTNRSLVDPGV